MSECHQCRDWGKYETHADHTRGGGAVSPEDRVPDLDDDGVLDDLANDYRGIDDTVQGRGDV